MAKASTHIAYYLFLLAFLIDEGDGRWKKMDSENLQRDIKLYKQITERVEQELREYYAEYEDHGMFHFNFNKNQYEANRNIPNSNVKLGTEHGQEKKRNSFLSRLSKITNNISVNNQTVLNVSASIIETSKRVMDVKTVGQKKRWPKFEDILLAIGKKYDWKNDRWIKVKQKNKIKDLDIDERDNSIIFHDKHRFSYRTIKLNRGKNKRNVVIAVTAIR